MKKPIEFCPRYLDVPGCFCTLRPKHVGPCSFHLSGIRADSAINDLQHKLDIANDALRDVVQLVEGSYGSMSIAVGIAENALKSQS